MRDRDRFERRSYDAHAAGEQRAADRNDCAALEEIAALRAVLSELGLTGSQPGGEPDDVEVEAAIARIVAPGGAQAADDIHHGTDGTDGGAPGVVDLASRRHRRTRRWWTATAGAAAAVLVAMGTTMLSGQTAPPAVAAGSPPMLAYPMEPGELAAGEGVSASDTLAELAAIAAARRDTEPVGDVQHTLSQSWLLSASLADDGTTMLIEPTVVESWLAPDGSFLTAEWRGRALGDDGQLQPVDTSPAQSTADPFPAGALDPDVVADLSLDPVTLRKQLLAAESSLGCDTDSTISSWCLYAAVTDLADLHVVSPAVESALWTVLAGEPDLILAGEVVDRLGRRSIAIAVPDGPFDLDPTVRVLLVDSHSGRFSGREEVTLSSEVMGLTEPTVTQFRYNVTNNWVVRVGGRSTGD